MLLKNDLVASNYLNRDFDIMSWKQEVSAEVQQEVWEERESEKVFSQSVE